MLDQRGGLPWSQFIQFCQVGLPLRNQHSCWQVAFYRPSTRHVYDTQAVSPPRSYSNTELGADFYVIKPLPVSLAEGLSGVALALADYTNSQRPDVGQFISLGGIGKNFTALDGPANGNTAVDTTVRQGIMSRSGWSLQLGGHGFCSQDFTW